MKIVTTEAPSGAMRGFDNQARKIVERSVGIEALRDGFTSFLGELRQIVTADATRVGDFMLAEITFSAEIGADGEFKLLGTGVGISASSAVSFVLRRQPTPSEIGDRRVALG
jgi:hypothetical protein